MLEIIVLIIFLGFSQSLDLCGDWTSYKDIKCIKVLEQIGTEEEAVNKCLQLDQSSNLITIHSKEEQDFIEKLLVKYNTISQNSWIGIKYLDKTYKWIDASKTDFENWAKDAVKDGKDECVQMSLITGTLGKWTDQSCKKTALIVCQKNQKFDLITFKTAFENLTNEVNSLKIQLQNKVILLEIQQQTESNETKTKIKLLETKLDQKTENSTFIPIGFLYTQLPNQSSPQQLWPSLKWLEVTKEYSGLFFRAEGANSLPFGEIQSSNQSWISDVWMGGYSFDSWKGDHGYGFYTSLNQTEWVDLAGRGQNLAIVHLNFYTTSGEVRPKNTAIKIWKRII